MKKSKLKDELRALSEKWMAETNQTTSENEEMVVDQCKASIEIALEQDSLEYIALLSPIEDLLDRKTEDTSEARALKKLRAFLASIKR